MIKIETIRGTPEGKVIRTMKLQPKEKKEGKGFRALLKASREKVKRISELKTLEEIKKRSKRIKTSEKKRKATTAVIKKYGSAIERAYKKGRPKYTKPARDKRYEVLRRKHEQLQMELRMKRSYESEALAAQQRATYEQHDDVPHYENAAPYEEEYVQQKPSLFQNVMHKLRPNPGIMQRLGAGSKSPQGKRLIKNSAQVGTRYIAGDGELIKDELMRSPQMMAPRITLLGTGQPNILNAPKVSFFNSQVNKPRDNLKW